MPANRPTCQPASTNQLTNPQPRSNLGSQIIVQSPQTTNIAVLVTHKDHIIKCKHGDGVHVQCNSHHNAWGAVGILQLCTIRQWNTKAIGVRQFCTQQVKTAAPNQRRQWHATNPINRTRQRQVMEPNQCSKRNLRQTNAGSGIQQVKTTAPNQSWQWHPTSADNGTQQEQSITPNKS